MLDEWNVEIESKYFSNLERGEIIVGWVIGESFGWGIELVGMLGSYINSNIIFGFIVRNLVNFLSFMVFNEIIVNLFCFLDDKMLIKSI